MKIKVYSICYDGDVIAVCDNIDDSYRLIKEYYRGEKVIFEKEIVADSGVYAQIKAKVRFNNDTYIDNIAILEHTINEL